MSLAMQAAHDAYVMQIIDMFVQTEDRFLTEYRLAVVNGASMLDEADLLFERAKAQKDQPKDYEGTRDLMLEVANRQFDMMEAKAIAAIGVMRKEMRDGLYCSAAMDMKAAGVWS